MIGAYGTGAKPILNFVGSTVGIRLSGTDSRICDLDLQSTSTTRPIWARGVQLGYRSLAYRCTVNNFGQALGISNSSEVTAYECDATNSSEYGLYASSSNDPETLYMQITGNRFEQAAQHLIRSYISRSIISHNLMGPSTGFTAMKLVGKPYPKPHHHVMLCDNSVTTEASGIIAIGPQNQQSTTEVAENFLIEGNRFHSQVAGDFCLGLSGPKMTVRNNIFDLASRHAVKISPAWGVGPVPFRCKVDHNTAYRGSGSPLLFLDSQSSDSTQVRNNILFCPNGTVSTTGSTTLADNLMSNPGFRNPAAGDFSFPQSSPAHQSAPGINLGTDFMVIPRPTNGQSTPGALLPN
jgi:hypothetical protein